jgi:hypothetical protein
MVHGMDIEVDFHRVTAAINGLTLRHGSLRAAARVLETPASYLCRLRAGKKRNPDAKLLKKLGLERVITYREARKRP